MADSEFPNVAGVNVYKYRNELDYSRYNYSQMKITVCTVPWDMGEAHIGNRTISGIGNVVYFEDKAARDAWFEAIPDSDCFRFETKYKELHRDNEIILPLPFDVAAKYNYIMVEYSLFANDNSPLEYENAGGVRKWFWFIREVEFAAPNATKVHLMADSWQQWIYDFEISGVMLERGHAPMFATGVSDYLANPIANSADLLAPDSNYSDVSIVRDSSGLILNTDVLAVFVTTAYAAGAWGTKASDNWTVPGLTSVYAQGTPSYYAFAVETADLATFLNNVQGSTPQFLQTVKGIFFAPRNLMTFGNVFTFGGCACWPAQGSIDEKNILTLSKEQFHYPARYADIAKLYTFPYAHIEVADESGNVSIIRIEETNGHLDLELSLNMIFPFIRINGHMRGLGADSAKQYAFYTANAFTFNTQGAWYRQLREWDIPIFGVIQAAAAYNDFATHYDRAQQAVAGNNAYSNAIASAGTQNTNTYADGDTTIANAQANINANVVQANLTTNANTQSTYATNTYSYETNSAANTLISNTANATIDYQEQQAAIGVATTAGNGIVGAVSSLATGNIPGAIGAIAGAGISAAGTIAGSNAAINLKSAEAAFATANNNQTYYASVNKSQSDVNISNSLKTDSVTATNSMVSIIANNSVGTLKANSTRTYNTAVANAGRDLNTVTSAIANQQNQARLNAPYEFGSVSGAQQAASRPLGIFSQIVTQPDSAIAQTGDEFLRYGYAYGRQWAAFDNNWNIGKHFTYWKLSEFWVKGLNIPDMYVDRLRFFLYGGVTVWRVPEEIGNISIYDNWPEEG